MACENLVWPFRFGRVCESVSDICAGSGEKDFGRAHFPRFDELLEEDEDTGVEGFGIAHFPGAWVVFTAVAAERAPAGLIRKERCA